MDLHGCFDVHCISHLYQTLAWFIEQSNLEILSAVFFSPILISIPPTKVK